MNYPTTINNPTLKRYEPKEEQKPKEFNNLARPISCPSTRLQRPFTGRMQSGLQYTEKRLIPDLMPNKGDEDFNPDMETVYKRNKGAQSQATLLFGKSIHNSNYQNLPNSAIGTVSRIVSAMPAPKTKKKKKKKAEAEPDHDDGGDGTAKKKKKKKKVAKSTLPEFPPTKHGEPIDAQTAL